MSKASAVVRRFFIRRSLIAALTCAATVGGVSAVGVSTASAALQWEAPITFECYNSGIIRADPIDESIASNQGEVAWVLRLYIWNGAARRWVAYYSSPIVHYNSDEMFGELADQPIDVRVAPNHYYMAYDMIDASATQNPPGLFRDHAEMGATSEFVCHVP